MNRIKKKAKLVFTLLAVLLTLYIFSALFVSDFYKLNIREDIKIQTVSDTVMSELMLSSSDAEMTKKVFDGREMTKFYSKLTGQEGADYEAVKIVASEKSSDTTGLGLKTGKTATEIYALNDSESFTSVILGNMEWYVTSLTLDDNGNVIATLMLKNPIDTSLWHTWKDASLSIDYPTSVYSTSYIRSKLLNGKGEDRDGNTVDIYYNSTALQSGLKVIDPDPDYNYSLFTDKNYKGNITKFIVKPTNVGYQKTESWNLFSGGSAKNALNDACAKVENNWGVTTTYEVQDRVAQYYDWQYDYLWIPGLCETGYGNTATGIWGMPGQLRINDSGIWSRTGATSTGIHAWILTENGESYWDTVTSDTHLVRPAFHFNLTEADKYSTKGLSAPQDVVKSYAGKELDLQGEKWYTQEYSQSVTVKFYDKSLNPLSTNPKDVGEYYVGVTPKSEYYWQVGEDSDEKKVKFTVVQKEVDYPSFYNAISQKTYNGGDNVTFRLVYDAEYVKISYKGAEISSSTKQVSEKNVGKYALTVELKDTKNCKWKNAKDKLEFEITKAQVYISLSDLNGECGGLTAIKGSSKKFNLELNAQSDKRPRNDDEVAIKIVATAKDLPDTEITGEIKLINNEDASADIQTVTFDTALLETTKYNLKATTTNGNYEIKIDPTATLDVKDEGSESTLRWKLNANGKPSGQIKDAEIGQYEVKLDKALVYSKDKAYTFTVSAPTGYEIDEEYGIRTVLMTDSGEESVETVKKAGKYKTTIKLKETANPTNVKEYSIEWTIDKAKYDLSGVKWEYDGKIPFSTNVSEMKAKIDEKTLPEGLSVERYTGVREGAHAGDSGNVSVTFILESGYEQNYELPQVGGKGNNYTYNGSEDFSWEMNWTIEKLVIKVEWESENYEGKYDRQKLKEDKNVVEYEYYLWDNAKKEIVGEALSESEIEIVENEVRYYVTKAVIKSMYANDVEFDKENVLSSPFSVGENATGIGVTLSKTELTYNGKSQDVKLKIEGALSESDFEIEYYDKDGTTALAEAPTKVGKYRVEIRIKEGVEGYYLSGENVVDGVAIIEYEIKQMEVKNDVWNTKHNPPSLSVSASEIKGIKHEYRDIDGNVLEFKDLKPGNKYEVRAVITDKNNYIFADGSTETEWVEFEVKENEEIFDPDDPNNPYYPSEDNNNSTNDPKEPTQTVDFDKVLDILKEWWQVIASGVSIVLILMFTAKGISFANKCKKSKQLIEKRYRTFYAMSGIGLFGWSMTNWTIIAGVLMGVAVLSLIFMLVEKKRYGKIEEEVDEAKEEYNKMMLMRMIGGNNNMQGQNYGYSGQPAVGIEDMRCMINDAVSAMLPNVQQYLPQQAQYSENEEKLDRLMQANEIMMQKISEQSKEKEGVSEEVIEKLVEKLSKQQQVERVIEKEVAATVTNDETIKQLLKNQEMLIKQIQELTANQQTEKLVDKIVEKPIEKIVEVPVEKIIEKEVVKEVKVEVPVEVEKIVEKTVPLPVEKPTTKTKTVAPRLTLDEAYAKLSKQQKKFFDTLKEYAMSKDKCKEKKSTYYILLGQSSVNPLIKLTIKKDCTVALFKMEDEYMKDIRRNAGSEGTKVKVKETELIVGDSQALATAKEMIDLREDQIERYSDYIKEQRSMRKS